MGRFPQDMVGGTMFIKLQLTDQSVITFSSKCFCNSLDNCIIIRYIWSINEILIGYLYAITMEWEKRIDNEGVTLCLAFFLLITEYLLNN